MYVFMYVCMYVSMYVSMYQYLYALMCEFMYAFIYIYTRLYACSFLSINLSVYLSFHLSVYLCIFLCMNGYMRLCRYILTFWQCGMRKSHWEGELLALKVWFHSFYFREHYSYWSKVYFGHIKHLWQITRELRIQKLLPPKYNILGKCWNKNCSLMIA